LLAFSLAGCSLDFRDGDGDRASASPTIAPAPPTRADPMTIVTPTDVPADATIPTGSDQPAENPQTYVVAEGDTLYGIALRFGVELSTLIQVNGLSDPNDIYVGQELQIPAR
jgi:nucleoid-associated protein YgaU